MTTPRAPAGSPKPRESTLAHLGTSVLYTAVTVVLLGLLYPFAIALIAGALFHAQAKGSLLTDSGGTIIGSSLVGQRFTRPASFHGRPSAAGKGYDPTSTGGTNLGPTSGKLIDATRAAVRALRRENPDATGPIPADLASSSASGIDPDISPEAAFYQIPRVARARHLSVAALRALVDAHTTPRPFGLLGEPRVNVLDLNRALDAQGTTHS